MLTDSVMLIEPMAAAQMRTLAAAVMAGGGPSAEAERYGVRRSLRVVNAAPSSYGQGVGGAPMTPAQMVEQHGYYKVGTLAVMPICGPIDRVESFWTRYFGGTTVDRIERAAMAILADGTVDRVALHVDSPGGTAMMDPALIALRKLAESKPTHGIVEAGAYSSGYWALSIADEVVVTRSAGVGSIGSMLPYPLLDYSEHLEESGIKVHGFATAEKKLTGMYGLPISEEQRASLQRYVESHGALIAGDVASARGLPVSKIVAMQGDTFVGARAIEAGLADRLVESVDAFIESLSGLRPGERMSRITLALPDERGDEPAEPESVATKAKESAMATNGTGTAPDKAGEKSGTEASGTEARSPSGSAAPESGATKGPANFEQLEAIASKLPESRRDGFVTACMRGKMTIDAAKDHLVECALKIAGESETTNKGELDRLRAENADLRKLENEGRGGAPVSGKPGGGAGAGGVEDKLGISACTTYEDAVSHVTQSKGVKMTEAIKLVNADPIGGKLREQQFARR